MNWIGAVLAALLVIVGTSAEAAETVTCAENRANTSCSVSSALVGPGHEFIINADFSGNILEIFKVDFSDGYLRVYRDVGGSIGYGGSFILSFTNLDAAFLNATIVSQSGLNFTQGGAPAFGQSNVSVSGGVLSLDFTAIQVRNGDSVTLAVVQAVPEPSTWLMMILGFGAVGYSLRRRKTEEPDVLMATAT